MRNDSFLNTGMTSSSTEPKTPREKQVKEKEEARLKLKPAADVVLEAIDIEKIKVTNLNSLPPVSDMSVESIKHELMARQLYLSYLSSLETKIKGILADKPKKGKL